MHFAFSGFRVLPTWEANKPDDPVDGGNNSLHGHGSLGVLDFGEQLGQRRLGLGL